ncbi:MAG: SsrA-binding protein, partial [Kribbellaceae bacterium]|nr:SsrA-binding protein [Kribbellaceae bacterium]
MSWRTTWRCHRGVSLLGQGSQVCLSWLAGRAVGLSGCRAVGLSGQNHRVKKPEADPVVARNRKAAHDYHLGESWEAGIVLQG